MAAAVVAAPAALAGPADAPAGPGLLLPHVKVAILVPYRPCRAIGMRLALIQFLEYMKRKLDNVLGVNNWVLMVGTQTHDGHLMSRARVLNALARLAGVRYPGYRLVFHDADLVPSTDRLREYCMPYPEGCRVLGLNATCADAQRSLKHNKPYIGGVCAMDYSTFVSVNGYNNVWEGWGGEDWGLLHRLTASGVKTHMCTAGLQKDLSQRLEASGVSARHLDVCKRDKAWRDDVFRKEKDPSSPTAVADGFKELVFSLHGPLTVLTDLHDSFLQCVLNVYVQLPVGWVMTMSSLSGSGKGRPYYRDVAGLNPPQFELPRDSVVEACDPVDPEDQLGAATGGGGSAVTSTPKKRQRT